MELLRSIAVKTSFLLSMCVCECSDVSEENVEQTGSTKRRVDDENLEKDDLKKSRVEEEMEKCTEEEKPAVGASEVGPQEPEEEKEREPTAEEYLIGRGTAAE